MKKKNMLTFISNNHDETKAFGEALAAKLKSGDVIALSGSLGAGKTVLVKGVAQALKIKEAIVSPTFTLVQEYEGIMPLYHLDLYRLSGEDEFESMGGEDFLYSDGLTFIEWSEKISSMLPDNTVYIDIQIEKDLSRKITVKGLKE